MSGTPALSQPNLNRRIKMNQSNFNTTLALINDFLESRGVSAITADDLDVIKSKIDDSKKVDAIKQLRVACRICHEIKINAYYDEDNSFLCYSGSFSYHERGDCLGLREAMDVIDFLCTWSHLAFAH